MRLRAKAIQRLMLPAVLALTGAVANMHAVPPQDPAPAKTPATQPPATTNAAPAEPQIPKSVFTLPSSPKEGRDPFYPDSIRLYGTMATNPTNTTKTAASATLALTGISIRGEQRLAIINNRSFGAGEEGDVTVPGGKLRIRCVEIRENSVLIEAGGEPRELRLPERKVREAK